MNIIIPIGGLGQRFKDDRFLKPKTLISFYLKPMIIRVTGRSINKGRRLL
jgi:dTDP-glucose pyrophosphorylase